MALSRAGANAFPEFVCKFRGKRARYCDKPNGCNDLHVPIKGFPRVGQAGQERKASCRRIGLKIAFAALRLG